VISFQQLGTTIDCTVRNLSEIGACLVVKSPISILNEFDLVLDRDKVHLHCRVAWRAADRIGVEFSALIAANEAPGSEHCEGGRLRSTAEAPDEPKVEVSNL
jgi:hypothetical protein